MAADVKDEQSYRVEVSGWDVGKNFFVERTMLSWERDGRKKILVRAPLNEGALVFVRLVSEAMGGRSIPMTYQVEKIGNGGSEQGREVHLERMCPKLTEAREQRALEEHRAAKA